MRRRILKSSINIRCTSDVITRLDALADASNQHRSELVRQAIILLIQSHEGSMLLLHYLPVIRPSRATNQ